MPARNETVHQDEEQDHKLQPEVEELGYPLVDDKDELSPDYFLHQYQAQGSGEVHYINVDSSIKAYLVLIADGKQVGKIIVGSGVQHIPFQASYQKRFDIYVMPHESVGKAPVDDPQSGQATVWFTVL